MCVVRPHCRTFDRGQTEGTTSLLLFFSSPIKETNSLRALVTTSLLGLLLFASVRAEPPGDAPGTPDQAELSAVMKTVQFVHIKLWFAGRLGNWKLATYELDQITPLLERAARHSPAGKEDIAAPLAALRNAVEAKDAAGFVRSYTELTNGCNACHRSAGYDFINVLVPPTSPFVDQDFADRVTEGRTLAHTICGICHAVPDKPNVPLGLSFPAPSFAELVRRPSFSEAGLRQLLASNHRRVGPDQAMPNPRLSDDQIEEIVSYFDGLKAEQSR
jgi:mono/diheme cytochrome c family protein